MSPSALSSHMLLLRECVAGQPAFRTLPEAGEWQRDTGELTTWLSNSTRWVTWMNMSTIPQSTQTLQKCRGSAARAVAGTPAVAMFSVLQVSSRRQGRAEVN
jgi:hypothetical protein